MNKTKGCLIANFATVPAKEQSHEDAGAYELAEQEAQARRIGLWYDTDPTPPWDWRRKDR